MLSLSRIITMNALSAACGAHEVKYDDSIDIQIHTGNDVLII
jgi:hypothetical protein